MLVVEAASAWMGVARMRDLDKPLFALLLAASAIYLYLATGVGYGPRGWAHAAKAVVLTLVVGAMISVYRFAIPSVGTVGESYDNALAECVIGLFKTEVINALGPWRTLRDVEWQTLKWIDWYNNRRLLAPIGYIPPAEAEQAYFDNRNILDQAA